MLARAVRRHKEGYEPLTVYEALGLELHLIPVVEHIGKSKSYKGWRVSLTGYVIDDLEEEYGEKILESLIGEDKTAGGAVEDLYSKMQKSGVYDYLYSRFREK